MDVEFEDGTLEIYVLTSLLRGYDESARYSGPRICHTHKRFDLSPIAGVEHPEHFTESVVLLLLHLCEHIQEHLAIVLHVLQTQCRVGFQRIQPLCNGAID